MNCTPIVKQYDILNNNWGVFMPRAAPNKRYAAEFKKMVIETMNRKRSKAKLKGLICSLSNFLGSLHVAKVFFWVYNIPDIANTITIFNFRGNTV